MQDVVGKQQFFKSNTYDDIYDIFRDNERLE